MKGSVFDNTNAPLPGVSILVKGSSNGTATDFDGNFSIDGVPVSSVLVFSYVGFKDMEVTVTDAGPLNIVLQEDTETLDEVVVIGYGTVKKSDLTGSVTSVKESDFNKGVYASPDALLQGKAPGVHVFNNDGTP